MPETDRTVGRPGMELWQVLVLAAGPCATVCTTWRTITRRYARSWGTGDRTRYEYQRVNVSLLTPELLSVW